MNRIATLSLSCLCMIALFSIAPRSRAADEPQPMAPPQAQPPMAQPMPAMPSESKSDAKTDSKKVLKPEEVKDMVGKEVIVEFVVVGGRELEDRGICFLNSSNDPSDPNGFTAFITKTGFNKFKEDAKIDHPADHFSQKTIRVSGKVKKYKDKAEIEVSSPDQIKVVGEEKKADEEKKM